MTSRLGPKLPRSPTCRGAQSPSSLATSKTNAPDGPGSQGTSTSSVRGPRDTKLLVRTSGHQRLATFISSVASLHDLDRSLDDLASSPHRRPWLLILKGPPMTWDPRPPSRLPVAWGMIPGLPTSLGDRCSSLTAGPRYRVVASPRDTKVPSSNGDLGPPASSVLAVPRSRC